VPFLRIFVIGIGSAFLLTAAQADSFVKGGTVVVLVGLPGDMESETAYGQQTQRLLELLDQPQLAPKKVLLLSSVPPPSGFQHGYTLDALPNDRATFLSLPARLKNGPGPDVFVVFGHGGNQGQTPVFHVPGPRLTPDDFSTVAAGEPASTWLLFFPGSGSFAQALQAPGRTLLATEAGDKTFTEDPVSFSLFLNALGKESDLDRLSASWGAATRDWYDSRQLARTEEPALWVNTDAPRKLAVGAVADGGAPGSGPPVPAPSPAAVATGAPPPSPATADAWKTIVPVDPSKYPESDAVTLSRKVSDVLDDNGGVTEDEETFLQILTPEGKRYGDFQFSFSPPDEDLNFLACEVRLPNGQIESLDPDEIRDAVPATPTDYDVTKQKMFSFPQIEPGAIIRIHLQRSWRHFPLPHVFQEIPLAGDNPTVALKVEIRVPDKEAFHFKLLHLASVDPVIGKTAYGSVYTWSFHDLPAVLDEPLSPPDLIPALAVTTFPDWASFSDWYIRLIRESNQPDPQLTKQAQDLIAGAASDEEKIKRITRFVTNFRYVSVPLGVNSFRPHSALHVWQNRYGDCKDKANLLGTLLTAVGFKTHLVLVPRFSQAYEDLPGFAFNHAIAAVQLAGKTLWIDSTDDVCRFGLLPPGDPGREVLVVDDQVNTLTPLPLSQANDHRLTVDTDVTLPDAAARDAAVRIEAGGSGYADYLLRASAQAAGSHQVLPLLAMQFSPTSGNFTPAHQQATAVDDLGQPFVWKADGSWDGLLSRLPESSTELLRLPGWVPHEWRTAALPRSNPLHLNQGYPMEIVQTWHIHLPPGSADVKLPPPQSDPGATLGWNLAWKAAARGEITARLDMILSQADLDQEQTRVFQASYHHLQETLQDGASFQHP
jgi:hypothetical protein